MIEKEREPIKFEIIRHIGTLNTSPTGWSKEFNIVKWNDRSEKFDIRDWAPGHERMSRGVTMHEDEVRKLKELCDTIFAPPEQVAEQTTEEVPF